MLALAGLLAAIAGTAAAQSMGEQMSGLKLSGDEPIQIESDRLEVHENESLAIFSGNVSVVQGTTLLKSGKMTVHYAKNGGGSVATGSSSIERIEVDEKVYVKSNAQIATGDRATFDMMSEVLTMSGSKVVLSEGSNVLVGCKLTVQMKTGLAKVDGCAAGTGGSGRVKMLLDPKNQ